ncbi:hypothetical protein L6R52_28315 [Myxococcota bacterium]|nr:hypothetical protein [Myxococcota bacterium]
MRVSFALPLSFVLGALACASDPDRPAGADGGVPDARVADSGVADTGVADTGVADSGGDSPDSGGSMDAGTTRDPACPETAAWLTTVEGTILDETGAASAGAKAQLCIREAPNNQLTCLRPADSDASGHFTINVPVSARCMLEATMRLVRPLEDRAVGYCHVDLADAAGESLSIDRAFRIFPTARATTIPPVGDGAASRTVVFADGLELDVVPDDYFPGSGEYGDLAAGRIDPAMTDDCIQAGQAPFDGIITFSPEGDVHGRVALRVPNTSGLAAGSAVDVWVLGGLGCTLDDDSVVPEGTWSKLEDGQVSADGSIVSITPGIPCLSWVAFRAK